MNSILFGGILFSPHRVMPLDISHLGCKNGRKWAITEKLFRRFTDIFGFSISI